MGPERVSWHEGGRSRNPGVWSESPHTWTLLLAEMLWRVGTLGIILEVEEDMNLLIGWFPVPRRQQTFKTYMLDE